jgi:catechol 2,3-dioxygenase-like lactoylglutathione lyase family enzyme
MFRNALAGIAVSDLEKAEIWYDNLLGRAPDTRPMGELVEWEFPGGGWLQVFVDRIRAGNTSITLVVSDFQQGLERLNELGIKILSVTQGDKVKVCIVHDPDGNQVVLAQGSAESHRAVM